MTNVQPLASPAPSRSSRPGAVLASVSLCTVLVVGFVASINLAVPMLAASELRPSASELLWIVDAYVVLFACLVIPAGALGDRYGRKGVLLGGLLVFAVGAALSAGAGNVAVMLAGRAITGVGAAAVLPNGLAVLVHATEPHRRPHALAVWAAMTGAGGVLGNIGGGAVLSAGSWRWLFVAVAPLALICAVWVALVAPKSGRHQRDLDIRGAVLLTLATLALLLGIIEGPEHGWSSVTVVGSFAAALVLAIGWLIGERRTASPMLDPRLFAVPALRAACLGMLIIFFGMFGFFFLNASLMQYSRGFSVLKAGLAVMPMTIPVLLAARNVPTLVARFGQRSVLAAAFLAVSAGLFGLANTIDRPYVAYAGWLVVVGIGVTLALPTLTAAITAAIPHEQAGVAGGLQATTRELGSALGVAVVGTLLTSRFVAHLPAQAVADPAQPPRTVAEATDAAPSLHDAVIAAYTAGAHTALNVVALVVLVAGVLIIAEMSWATRRHPLPAGN